MPVSKTKLKQVHVEAKKYMKDHKQAKYSCALKHGWAKVNKNKKKKTCNKRK